MKVDDVLNLQLHYHANNLKRATGARHAAVMVGDDINCAAGISTEYQNMSSTEVKATQVEVMYMMVQSANIVLKQMTGQKLYLEIVGPDGAIEMRPSALASFQVTIE